MEPGHEESHDTAYDLVTEVLSGVAPEELPDLPLVWDAWLRDPADPAELRGDEDRVLGSGLMTDVVAWAPLIVSYLGTNVLVGAAVDEAKEGVRRHSRAGVRAVRGRWRRRRERPAPDTRGLPTTPEAIRDVAAEAERAALALGRSPEDARRLGDHLAGVLTRRAAG